MDLTGLHRLTLMSQMGLVFTTWPEMYGNGAMIGFHLNGTWNLLVKLGLILKVLHQVIDGSIGEAVTSVIPVTVIGTG
jgi:hypothetical protein